MQSRLPIVVNSWKPRMGASGLQAAGAVVVLVGAEGFLVKQMLSRGLDLGSFLLALLVFVVAGLLVMQSYALYCLHQLRYELGSESLTIKCGVLRYVLSLESIEQVMPLRSGPSIEGRAIEGRIIAGRTFALGYPDRTATLSGIGEVRLVANTTAPSELALVTMADASFVVSPGNRDAFIDRVNVRRSRLQFQPARPEIVLPQIARLTFWHDRTALALLLAGIVGNLILLAYVSYKFPALPPLLPLHFNSAGEIDFIGTRAEAFKIPAIGTVAVMADLLIGAVVHAREKVAAHIVLSTAIVVQIILLVAIVKIVY